MQEFLLTAFMITLMNVAVHALFWPGMIAGNVAATMATILDETLGKKWSKIIQKPLWECLTCMSAIWSFIWWKLFPKLPLYDPYNFIQLVLVVAGMSTVIDMMMFANFRENGTEAE